MKSNIKKFMYRIVIVSFILSFIINLKAETLEDMRLRYDKKYPNIKHISVKEYLQNPQSFVLVDVRPDNEQKISVIPNSTSYKIIEKNFKKYKNKKLLVYCTIGERSSKYAEKLFADGFANVTNLRGGVLSWAENGKLFIDPTGKKTKRVHVYGEKWNILPKEYKGVW